MRIPSLSLMLLKPRLGFNRSFSLAAAATATTTTTIPSTITSFDPSILRNGHAFNNIPDPIISKVGKNLHLNPNHPIGIIKSKIESYCNEYAKENGQSPFAVIDALPPLVSTTQCFDELRVGPDHVSRKPTDTYYFDNQTVLRTHTSAHQTDIIAKGHNSFLVVGDVYRRDQIDASHYPVFHQMEGVRLFPRSQFAGKSDKEIEEFIRQDLQGILSGLAKSLFGSVEMRWNEDYFPFTHPSYELEVLYQNNWLEVLGCGIVHPEVIDFAKKRSGNKPGIGSEDQVGWAFGLGLERLAMVLFNIPDIRLFWSDDERFTSQFKAGQTTKFVPFSKYPGCYKDVSFWLPKDVEGEKAVHVNDVYELIHSIAGDIVENVTLFDEFVHPKTGKKSLAFRIMYRSMTRNLLNSEVDELQFRLRDELVSKLKVELR